MFGWIVLSLMGIEYVSSLASLLNVSIPRIFILLSPIVTLLSIIALFLVLKNKLLPKRSFLLPLALNFLLYCAGIIHGMLALDQGFKGELMAQNNQQQFLAANYPFLFYFQWIYSIGLIIVWVYAIYYYGAYRKKS